MFETEEMMIDYFINIYNKNHVYKEVGSGYGIADLVIVNNKKDFSKFSKERNGLYLQNNDQIKIFKYMRKKRRGVTFDELYKNHFFSKNNLKHNILKYLVSIRALLYRNNSYYRNPEFRLFPINCIAIEGKLSNWNAGLVQAIRYKRFARKSFVAIDESYAHRVNLEMFKEQNIGLITVGSKVKIEFSPNNELPLDPVMRYGIAENLLRINS